jgi:glycosyltransferase involved in cell wall biosynthesis
MLEPKISIITPSFNQDRFLEEAVNSVVGQQYKNLEYILMDGGSSDSSIEIIKKYSNYFKCWQSANDKGQADAINKGWRIAEGQILGWLNSDDLLNKDTLKNLAKYYSKNPAAKIFYGDCAVIDADNNLIDTKRPFDFNFKKFLSGKSLGQPSVFITSSIIQDQGYLDENLTFALDWAYFLKLFYSVQSDEIVYIPEVLSFSREYEGTKTRVGLDKKGEERREKIYDFFIKGELENNKKLYYQGISGTYWVQAIDEFLAKKKMNAFISSLKAFYYNPASIFEKINISKFKWLKNESLRRFRD